MAWGLLLLVFVIALFWVVMQRTPRRSIRDWNDTFRRVRFQPESLLVNAAERAREFRPPDGYFSE